MNTAQFQTVSNYIKAAAGKKQFSQDTARRLMDGELQLRDNTDYIRKEISASPSGTIKLIDANTNVTEGISTFVGNKFDKSINQVITHLRVGYAGDVAAGKEAALTYKNDEATVPAGLRSASLIISQDGKTVVKLPVMDFVKPGNDGDSAYSKLNAFALIKEEQPFSIELAFADGVSLGADKHYVEVALKGMSTFQR